MATTSNIAMAVDTDEGVKYFVTYSHWDGYPSGVGRTLLQHYTDEVKIRQLIELGHLSIVSPEIGEKHAKYEDNKSWCFAYGRDGEEEDCDPWFVDSKNLIRNEDYGYLWQNGRWYIEVDGSFVPLTEELMKD